MFHTRLKIGLIELVHIATTLVVTSQFIVKVSNIRSVGFKSREVAT